MSISEIILVITITIGICLHVINIVPVWLAGRRLERLTHRNSNNSITNKRGWQFLMFKDIDLIFSDLDTPEERLLKQEYVGRWKYSLTLHKRTIWIFIIGFVLSFIANWASYFVKGQP